MCITNKKNPIRHNYFIHGQKLPTKSDSKYLGIAISSNLSSSKHVNNIFKKANSTMALKRIIRPASQQAKSTAYKTFVRPTLEYVSTVWSPHTDTDSNQVEMVHRRAVRFVRNDYSRKNSVTAMHQDLSWGTLLHHRDQARMSMMYRIAHQQVDIPAERSTWHPLTTEPGATTHDSGRSQIHSPVKVSSPERSYCRINSRKSSEPVNAGGTFNQPHIIFNLYIQNQF